MKKLLLIVLLIVGCEKSTEYEEPSVTEYPNQTGSSWTYACNMTFDDSLMSSGYSYLKIIENFPNNYSGDSCGVETIIFEKVDSMYYSIQKTPIPLPDGDSDDPVPPSNPSVIDSVFVDTLIYSMTEDRITYCLSASSLNQNSSDMPLLPSSTYRFHQSNPPKIQYPLFIGQSWEESYGTFVEPKQYEVISSQYVATENKIYNCYLIKRLGLANIEYNYYISSEGLIKSSSYGEVDRFFPDSPYAGEIVIAKAECILVNTNPR